MIGVTLKKITVDTYNFHRMFILSISVRDKIFKIF